MSTRLLIAAVTLLVLAGPALPKEPKKLDPIDYGTYYELLPTMKKLSEDSITELRKLNHKMKELGQTLDEAKAAKLRTEIREILVKHREAKLRAIGHVDKILLKKAPERTDIDALRAIRKTQLRRVGWKNTFLKYVARDISRAIGVPIRLNAIVQELNQVEIYFPEISAEGVMNLICQNFELKWLIYGGEILVLKKITPNEARFIEWEKKHGKVDWISEDEAGTYEDLPTEEGKRKLKKVENMDLPLLEHNMTKIYILEGQGKIEKARLEEFKFLAQSRQMFEGEAKTEEAKAERYKRHKHILHYLYMERERSIEVWDVVNRVLGDVLALPDDDAALRRLLAREVPRIEWRDKDLEEALYELGRMINVPVEAELPPLVEMSVNLTVENVTVETVINLICDIHPLQYRYINGRLFFAHMATDDK